MKTYIPFFLLLFLLHPLYANQCNSVQEPWRAVNNSPAYLLLKQLDPVECLGAEYFNRCDCFEKILKKNPTSESVFSEKFAQKIGYQIKEASVLSRIGGRTEELLSYEESYRGFDLYNEYMAGEGSKIKGSKDFKCHHRNLEKNLADSFKKSCKSGQEKRFSRLYNNYASKRKLLIKDKSDWRVGIILDAKAKYSRNIIDTDGPGIKETLIQQKEIMFNYLKDVMSDKLLSGFETPNPKGYTSLELVENNILVKNFSLLSGLESESGLVKGDGLGSSFIDSDYLARLKTVIGKIPGKDFTNSDLERIYLAFINESAREAEEKCDDYLNNFVAQICEDFSAPFIVSKQLVATNLNDYEPTDISEKYHHAIAMCISIGHRELETYFPYLAEVISGEVKLNMRSAKQGGYEPLLEGDHVNAKSRYRVPEYKIDSSSTMVDSEILAAKGAYFSPSKSGKLDLVSPSPLKILASKDFVSDIDQVTDTERVSKSTVNIDSDLNEQIPVDYEKPISIPRYSASGTMTSASVDENGLLGRISDLEQKLTEAKVQESDSDKDGSEFTSLEGGELKDLKDLKEKEMIETELAQLKAQLEEEKEKTSKLVAEKKNSPTEKSSAQISNVSTPESISPIMRAPASTKSSVKSFSKSPTQSQSNVLNTTSSKGSLGGAQSVGTSVQSSARVAIRNRATSGKSGGSDQSNNLSLSVKSYNEMLSVDNRKLFEILAAQGELIVTDKLTGEKVKIIPILLNGVVVGKKEVAFISEDEEEVEIEREVASEAEEKESATTLRAEYLKLKSIMNGNTE